MGKASKAVVMLMCIAAVDLSGTTAALARKASVAELQNTGAVQAYFCTDNPNVMVVHACQGQDANSSCAIGFTLLKGVNGMTYRLGNGNHTIAKGCYYQTLGDTTVVGTARAVSTLWRD